MFVYNSEDSLFSYLLLCSSFALFFFHFNFQLSLIKHLVYLANVIEWKLNGCFQSFLFLIDHDFSNPKFCYGGRQEFIFVFALFKGIELITPSSYPPVAHPQFVHVCLGMCSFTCGSPLVCACVCMYVLISTCILQSTLIDQDLWSIYDFQLQNSSCLIKRHFSF